VKTFLVKLTEQRHYTNKKCHVTNLHKEKQVESISNFFIMGNQFPDEIFAARFESVTFVELTVVA